MKLSYVVVIGVALGSTAGLSGQEAPQPGASVLMQAMRAELTRSMDGLKNQAVPPYFLSYAVTESHDVDVSGSFGALQTSAESRHRLLDLDVRVGDYSLDNTHEIRRENKLISAGILKTLLNGRDPAPGALRSTGNFRGAAVTPSNLIVQVSNGLSSDEIKAQLLKEVAKRNLPFGITVRRIGTSGGANFTGILTDVMAASMGQGTRSKRILLAYKVFPDSHEELVRGAELTGLNAASFKDVLAATREEGVYSAGFGAGADLSEIMGSIAENFGGQGLDISGSLVTYVVPSLLFDDASFSRKTEQIPKPPYLSPPSLGKNLQ